MSQALAFLRAEAAARLLERAARCAGTPLSLHYVERNQEGTRVMGWGGCRACRYAAELPGGRAACRQSRVSAASVALRQDRPVVFLCHMGFACAASPVLSGEGFVMTFGPYVPAGEAQSLVFDACNGLAALTGAPPETTFPEALDDIREAPANAVPAIAEWVREALEAEYASWSAGAEGGETVDAEEPEEAPARRGASRKPVFQPFSGAEIAAALAAGGITQARHLLRGCLAEAYTHSRVRIGVRRARMMAAAAAALEAAEHAGLGVARAWDAFPDFAARCRKESTDAGLIDAAMDWLGLVARDTRKQDAAEGRAAEEGGFAALNDMIQRRLLEGITLDELAAHLNETPSAITRRLQRKFGMSFSEYVGRMRVEKAKELLRRTQLSATEVARRVGVQDQSNFGKLFKKYTGKTPMQYRETFARRT